LASCTWARRTVHPTFEASHTSRYCAFILLGAWHNALKGNELTGAIVIYHQRVRPFTEKPIELVANFAKRAVIAIENARLSEQVRARHSRASSRRP
jgi:GAF domain-containing protein